MLRETSTSSMKKKGIPKDRCVFVARKRGNDEIAPSDSLFQDFSTTKKALEQELGKGSAEAHNQAFITCSYEERFREQILEDPRALEKLQELCRRAETEDVFLVCYEGPGKACHRRILMRIAEERLGAEVLVEGAEP